MSRSLGLYPSMFLNVTRRSQAGMITLQACRNRREKIGKAAREHVHAPDEIEEILQGSIAFLSNAPLATRIAVAFQQTTFASGSCLSVAPKIVVSALRPNDDEPFRLIAKGDLDGLIGSLSLKKCRLSDRDAQGRCLLHVSLA